MQVLIGRGRAVGRYRARTQCRWHIVQRIADAEADQFGDDREHNRKAEHDARMLADCRECAIENLADTQRPQGHDAGLVFSSIAAVLAVLAVLRGLPVLAVLRLAVLRRRTVLRWAGRRTPPGRWLGCLRRLPWRGRLRWRRCGAGEVFAGIAKGSWCGRRR